MLDSCCDVSALSCSLWFNLNMVVSWFCICSFPTLISVMLTLVSIPRKIGSCIKSCFRGFPKALYTPSSDFGRTTMVSADLSYYCSFLLGPVIAFPCTLQIYKLTDLLFLEVELLANDHLSAFSSNIWQLLFITNPIEAAGMY